MRPPSACCKSSWANASISPASSITEAVVDERLRPLGVPEETLARVQDVFQRCNQYRYAPIQHSGGLFLQFPAMKTLKILRNLESDAQPAEKNA